MIHLTVAYVPTPLPAWEFRRSASWILGLISAPVFESQVRNFSLVSSKEPIFKIVGEGVKLLKSVALPPDTEVDLLQQDWKNWPEGPVLTVRASVDLAPHDSEGENERE